MRFKVDLLIKLDAQLEGESKEVIARRIGESITREVVDMAPDDDLDPVAGIIQVTGNIEPVGASGPHPVPPQNMQSN